ncbi:MAG: FtsQ-type POTRA domain-containing protein [Candidatus Staskawiczbacteria bacterium]|nr:FtsQ-type POTRA domain-containing protein [Candidatus Staskawiczbacteria bacterium]
MRNRRHHIKNKVLKFKNKKSIFKKPIFWIVVLFVIIVFLFLYLFLFFSEIYVNSVIIEGNNTVQSKDIENMAWDYVNKNISKSIFLVRPKIISKDVLDKFPQIESAKVSIKFPETINIQIKERTIFAVFCPDSVEGLLWQNHRDQNNKKCFYMDENGVIFEMLEQIPENTSILRQITEEKEVFIGQRVIEKNVVDVISKIKKNLKNNFQIGLKTASISTPRLNIETSENWQIYFNLDSETDLQIEKMNLLLKSEIPIIVRKSLQYMDLRFRDRAYYK